MAATTITRDRQVLDAVRATRSAMTDLEIELLVRAVEWVELHPGDEVDESVDWSMREMEIAGDGAPTIDEGAIAEFALAIGMSTDSGRVFLGDAVELCHRLPRTWKRVVAREVPVWKARRVSQSTMSLSLEGAAHVDRAIAWCLHKCSFAEIERQVEKARADFDPVETEARRLIAAEKRHLKVHLDYMTSDGLVPISGMVDVADAVAFDATLSAKAKTLDPALPLDVRRAMAVGMLGDGSQREVVVYAHTRPGQAMVDLDNTRSVITPDHLKDWCQQAGTKVTVRPVIDLNDEELSTHSYEPTERIKEQVRLIHPTCAFPRCGRPSRGCDLDHIIEWPLGPTTTSNLAPLCRGHHRLKTHTDWTYEWVTGVGFVWTSPLGQRHIG